MEKFTFDLQRFANTWKMNDKEYTSLKAAVNEAPTDGTETVINLTNSDNSKEDNPTFKSGHNITISCGNSTNLKLNGNVTIPSGATVTFTANKLNLTNDYSTEQPVFTNSGTLTLNGITSDRAIVTNSGGTTHLYNSAVTMLSSKVAVAYTDDDGNKVQYAMDTAVKGKTLTFSFDENGAASVSGIGAPSGNVKGTKFTAVTTKTDGTSETVIYEATAVALTATRGTDTRPYIGAYEGKSIPMSSLIYDNIHPAIMVPDISELPLDYATITGWGDYENDEINIVNENEITKEYGKVIYRGNDTVEVYNADNTKWGKVTVDAGLIAVFAKEFQNIPITVDTTQFTSTTEDAFTVNGAGSNVSVDGAVSLTLTDGTLLTAQNDQTIVADSHTLTGYTDSGKDKNGLLVTPYDIDDINEGESFKLDDATYTKAAVGIISTDQNGGIDKFYTGDSEAPITLSSFADKMKTAITPNDDKVLILGVGKATADAAVLSSTDVDDASRLADLTVKGKNHTLDTIDGGDVADFKSAVDTISVAGGATTINYSLISGDGTVIVTSTGATFIVNQCTDSFTVNGTTSNPTVTDADELTLLGGSITASADQTINIGNRKFVAGGNMTIAFTPATDTEPAVATVTGKTGNTFKLDGTEYALGENGDGMTFDISNADVIISGFDKTKEALTIGTTNYSLNSAGFMREDSNSNISLWNKTDYHTLEGGTVTYSDLTVKSSWATLATVDAENNSATVAADTGTVILIGDDYASLYGSLTKSGSAYNLQTVTGGATFDSLTINDKLTVTLGAGLTDVTISADGVATLAVTDDAADGYQLTLSGAAAQISNGETLTLIEGALAADSNVTVNTNSKDFYALGTATVTLDATSSDATINGIDATEAFSYGGISYTLLSDVERFIRSDGMVWSDDEISDGSVVLSELTDNNWNAVIAGAASFTLTGEMVNSLSNGGVAFIVDDTANPTEIYGSLTRNTAKAVTLSMDGSNTKFTAVTVPNNVAVTFTDEFQNISVTAGSATFTAPNKEEFTVTATTSAVTVADAKVLKLLSGTLTLTDSKQIVTAGKHSVNQESGTVTVNYDGTNVTVGSLDEAGDSVTVNNVKYTLSDGDGISVKISGNKTLVEGITSGDIFTIGEDTFVKTNFGFIKNDSYLWTNTDAETEVDVSRFTGTSTDDWTHIIASPDGVITITATETGILVDQAGEDGTPTTIYGQLTNVKNVYTLTQYENNTPTGVKLISVDGLNASIAKEYAKIPVNATNKAVITTDGTELTFAPETGDTFTFGGTKYVMTDAGLTHGNYIWTTAGEDQYVLPTKLDARSWSKMLVLTDDGVLNLNSSTPDSGLNIVVDSGKEERMAQLTYAANDYDFRGEGDNTVETIQMPAGTMTVTTNFDTTINTGEGTYTVNDANYVGKNLSISATSSGSTLFDGTVTISADSVTANETISVENGSITATAKEGEWTRLGSLSTGDKFKIGDTTYAVGTGGTLAILDASGNYERIYTSYITGSAIDYAALTDENNYSTIVELTADGVLNLDFDYAGAIVTAKGDPTTRVADVTFSGSSYTLTKRTDGDTSVLKSVNLGSNSLTTDIDTTVNTTGAGEFDINGNNFTARGDLTFVTPKNNAYLTAGSVTVSSGDSVIVRRKVNSANKDENITSTGGTFTVEATGTVTTISALNEGTSFSVGSSAYTMTSVGLATSELTKLNTNITDSVTTADLGTDLKTVHVVENGALVVTQSTGADVVLANLDDPTNATYYGTLTKANGLYTLTTSDTELTSITADGVKISLPPTETSITAGTATFTAEATDNFTVDGAKSFTDAPTVYLTAGIVNVSKGTTVHAGGYQIAATSDISVSIYDDVVIGNLNTGDTFSVDGTAYTMNAGGLYVTESKQIVTAGVSEDLTTFTPSEAQLNDIIAPEGNVLDLTNQKSAALVYDDLTAPKVLLGTVSVGSVLELEGTTSAAANIKSVIIPATPFTVDFVTLVTAPAGTVTVNDTVFDAAEQIIVQSDGETATLYSGSVVLDNATPSATADVTIQIGSGTFTAKADAGKFTSISGLDADESFIYNGTTYTQTALGLVNDFTIAPDLTGTTIDLSKLTSAKWYNIVNAQDVLDLNTITADSLVIDGDTKLGTVTVSNGAFTIDFSTQVKASGTVTINGTEFNSAEEMILDVTADSATLNTGTVAVNGTATATNDSISGKGFTATAENGKFIQIDGLNAGETFTYGGTTYTQTDLGLISGNTIATDLSGSTIELKTLDAADWQGFITPTDGVIDLNTITADSLVIEKNILLGTVTISNGAFTVDFSTQAKATGTVTVNDVAYDATGEIILDVTADSSTLNTGTVNVNGTATATNDSISGNGFNATAKAGKFTSISGLNAGETFTYNGTTYTQSDLGLVNGNTIATDLSGTTIDLSKLASAKWFNIVNPTDGLLDLNTITADSVIIDDGKKLGTVTVSNGAFTVDFSTQAKASGTVTVNKVSYDGAGEIILDVTAKIATLNAGTVNVNGNVVATNDTISGKGFTATALEGKFTTVSGLDANETFTYGGDKFKLISNVGLFNSTDKTLVTSGYANGTVNLDAMVQTATIAPTKNVIDLTKATTSIVVDNATNPTKILGNLTVSPATFTLDFATQVKTAADVVTVNGATYNATTALTLDVTAQGSTLTEGTVTLASGESVTTTGGSTISSGTNAVLLMAADTSIITPSDVISVKVKGDTVTISDFDIDDTFSVDGKTYTVTQAGIISGNKLWAGYGTSVTTDDLADESNWKALAQAPDGNIRLSADSTGGVILVDDITNPTKNYGTLAKNGDKFTLTAGSDAPNKITVDEVAVTFDSDFASVPITTVNADNTDTTFSVTTKKAQFTVDATGTEPVVGNVSSLDLSAGKIRAQSGVAITGSGQVLATSGSYSIGSSTVKLTDQTQDAVINLSNNQITSIALPTAGATLSLDGTTYTVPAADSVLAYSDGEWFFQGYEPTSYTVYVDKSGKISADPGIRLSDVVGSGNTLVNGALTLATDKPVTIVNKTNLTVYRDSSRIVAINGTGSITINPNSISDGKSTISVSGDSGGFAVSLKGSAINAISDIANATVTGFSNGSITTDAQGTITVDKTFFAPAGTVYTVTKSKITAATADSISGDFSNGVKVNGTYYNVSGGMVTVNAEGNVQANAGTYSLNGKSFVTDVPTTFLMGKNTVTGASLSANGTIAVYNDDRYFAVNNSVLSYQGNYAVTLTVADDSVTEVDGLTGSIAGLVNATVNDISNATVNGTALVVSEADVVVESGQVSKLTGVDSGATVTTAPNMTVSTAQNGTFAFPNGAYNINDTVDGSVEFITDKKSNVADIAKFAGSISGSLESVRLNGKQVSTNGAVTISTDGTNITGVNGMADGTSIKGDLEEVTFSLPSGSVTIEGAAYTLAGDGVAVRDNVITGLANGATVTLGTAGEYSIDSAAVSAKAGDAYTVNRDGLYKIEPSHQPISDDSTVPSAVIVIDTDESIAAGDDSIAVRHDADATIDVADGSPTIMAVSGSVTLENYHDNAPIATSAYSNVIGAVKRGEIKFGDGTMTLGDAVITFDDDATAKGKTAAEIINATGDEVELAFTHSDGGTINTSSSSSPYLLKGNYAESTGDTQKSGGSTLTSGAGNDTLLIGAGDVANAGAGNNQIFITDGALRTEAATVVLSSGKTVVHNFNDGFGEASDKIQITDLGALEYDYGTSGLKLTSGNAQLSFDNDPDKLKLTDGRRTYTAQFAADDEELKVDEPADIFYGNEAGINFGEYKGTVQVNLGNNLATLDGSTARMYGINKVTAGAGDATLTGSSGSDTLAAGSGNAVINSGKGNDLMQGGSGVATFQYTAGDGSDTVEGFKFMAGEDDTQADVISLNTARNTITDIHLDGSDVVIGINGSDSDWLTVKEAQGKHMLFNDIIAKVDTNIAYDGYTDCYVGGADDSTLQVGAGFDVADICLGIEDGTQQYIGRITVLDASNADGITALVGNELNNLIIGGKGQNSIWGGDNTDDTLVGGTGQNTFFFALENGNDIIRNAHDGDIIDLHGVYLDNIASTNISRESVSITLSDGSKLNVQSAAAVEYKLADGSTYTADHTTGEWERKE
ncbi:MAG: hypothetical protein SR2Q5_01905 [Quinella sp. 2Q5]|nr:hypothetical protein [Quinella sp. 2Q5]